MFGLLLFIMIAPGLWAVMKAGTPLAAAAVVCIFLYIIIYGTYNYYFAPLY